MSLSRNLAIVVVLAAIGCSQGQESRPVVASGEDATAALPCSWPRFHGPKNDNLSTDTGLLKQWPEDGPKLLWSAKGLGQGYASVAIADGLIYTAGNAKDKTVVTAMDMTGNVKWQVPVGEPWTGQFPGARSTPTIDGDRLYYETPLGQLACLNAKTGDEIWSVNILEEFGAKNIIWALAESPLIDGDRLICCPGGEKTSVVALDKKTGKAVWTAQSKGDLAGYATPKLVEHQGLRIILTMNEKALIGVNADDGDLLFRYPHKTQYDVNATTPLFHDGQIFISSGYKSGSEMLTLKVDGKKASVEKLWEAKELDNQHGGLVLVDGYLYGSAHQAPGANRNPWLCLEWKTGKKMYAAPGVKAQGSLTYADGMLYTLSEKQVMGLVPASPKEHKVVSEFKLPKGGEGASWAHPVVCGGRLYLRHGEMLFAYDVHAAK